ncbi:MAG: hypothetical protein DCC64_11620 [Planctomycetota bacterium]|nr:MAG: hypothetical protein DCC64_11620 [Planctomycetota bacterium]
MRARLAPLISGLAVIDETLADFLQSGLACAVATRDARLVPDCVLAVGVRIERDRRHATVFVHDTISRRTLANLKHNGQIAVTLEHLPDHHAIQLKGEVTRVAAATEADIADATRFHAGFVKEIEYVGVAPRFSRRLAFLPCHAVTFRVEAIFEQTPGPKAGACLKEAP